MKVLMLVLNTFENDSRVHRAAKTLADNGIEVMLLCVHREGLPREYLADGYCVVRCDLTANGIEERAARALPEPAVPEPVLPASALPAPAAEGMNGKPGRTLLAWLCRPVRLPSKGHSPIVDSPAPRPEQLPTPAAVESRRKLMLQHPEPRAPKPPARSASPDLTARATPKIDQPPPVAPGRRSRPSRHLRLTHRARRAAHPLGTLYWPLWRGVLRIHRRLRRRLIDTVGPRRRRLVPRLRRAVRPAGVLYWPARRGGLKLWRGLNRRRRQAMRSTRTMARPLGIFYWPLRRHLLKARRAIRGAIRPALRRTRKTVRQLRPRLRLLLKPLGVVYWPLRRRLRSLVRAVLRAARKLPSRSVRRMRGAKADVRRVLRPLGVMYWPLRRRLLSLLRAARRLPSRRGRWQRQGKAAVRRVFRPLGAVYWPARRRALTLRRSGKRFTRQAVQKSTRWVARTARRVPGRIRSSKTLRMIRRSHMTDRMLRRLRRLFPAAAAFFAQARLVQSPFEKRKRRYEAFGGFALDTARAFRPDVVHAHDFNCLLAAEMIHDAIGVPFVYDSHELWVERNRPSIEASTEERLWEKEAEGRAIRKATVSMTVCKSIAEHLAREYSVPEPMVVRNTPSRQLVVKDAARSLRTAIKAGDDDFVGVYVGIVADNRGVFDILRALPKIDRRFKFVTLGPFHPSFRPRFDAMVAELGLHDRVFCHAPVESRDVAVWIADCDLSLTTMNRVCLSYVYALPNKLFESVQAALPIVGPDSPEIERLIATYECGTTYRDQDPDDLAARISALMDDRQQLERFRQGSRRAGAELCWEVEQHQLLCAYRGLMAASGVTPLLQARGEPAAPQYL